MPNTLGSINGSQQDLTTPSGEDLNLCGVPLTVWQESSAPTGERVALLACFLTLAAVGVAGNSLVLLVSIRARQYRRSAVHTYVTHLAAADLFFLAFCAPVHSIVFFLSDRWPLGELLCRLLHFLQPLAMHASAAFLVAMTTDRCLRLRGAGGARRAANASRCAAGLWAASVAMAAPWPLVYSAEGGVCTFDLPAGWPRIVLFSGRAALGYVIPLALIAGFSTRMLRRLWLFRRPGGRANRRVTALVVSLVMSFLICWLPLHVSDLLGALICHVIRPDATAAGLRVYDRFNHVTTLLSYCSACANPAIYSCLSESFRRGLRQMLGRPCRRSARSRNR